MSLTRLRMSIEDGKAVFQRQVAVEGPPPIRPGTMDILDHSVEAIEDVLPTLYRHEVQALLEAEQKGKTRKTLVDSLTKALYTAKVSRPGEKEWETLTREQTTKLFQRDLTFMRDRNRVNDAITATNPMPLAQVQAHTYNVRDLVL